MIYMHFHEVVLWNNYYCKLHNEEVPWWSPSKIKVILIIEDRLIENILKILVLEHLNEHEQVGKF